MVDVPPQQFECLVEAIYHEARGESLAGQVHVGFVVRNRVESNQFPDGFCKVIAQPWQFSFYSSVSANIPNGPVKREVEQVAYMVVNTNPSPIPSNVLYFKTAGAKPNWDFSKLVVYKKVGNHVFYSE